MINQPLHEKVNSGTVERRVEREGDGKPLVRMLLSSNTAYWGLTPIPLHSMHHYISLGHLQMLTEVREGPRL